MSRTGSGPAVQTLVFPFDKSCTCDGCDRKTKKALARVEGVKKHFYDLEKNQLIVTGTGTMDRDTVFKKLSKLKRLHVRFADNDLNDQRPPMQPQGVDCNGCLPRHGPPVHPPPRSGQHGQPPLGLPHQPPHHEVQGCNNELPPPSSACHCPPPPHNSHIRPSHGPVHLRINEPPQQPPYSACHCAPPPPHFGYGPPPPRMQLPHYNQPPPPSSACHCPPPPEFNHAPPPPMQLPHYNQPPPSSACHCPPPEHNHAPPPPQRPQPPHHAPNDALAVFDNFVHGPASPLIPPNVCPAGLLEKLANIGRIKQVDLINKKGIKLTFEDGHVTSYHPTSYMEIRPGYDCAALPPSRYVSPFSDENPNGVCSIM